MEDFRKLEVRPKTKDRTVFIYETIKYIPLSFAPCALRLAP
jgi:hypothetical protein